MDCADAVGGRFDGGGDFRQHAAVECAVGGQFVDAARGEAGQQAAVFVQHACGVGHHNQFFGLQFFGQFAGDEVGVDVEGAAVFAHAYRGDDGDAAAFDDAGNQGGVYAFDRADAADVRLCLFGGVDEEFFRFDEVIVAAGDADGFRAALVEQGDNFFIDEAAEHHFDDAHGFVVGNAHSLDEFAFLADFFQHFVNLRPAAVDDDGVDADEFEQGDVFGEAFFQMLFGHGVAAVFDNEDAACKAADVGQDFGQYGGLGFGCYGVVRYVHVLAFFLSGRKRSFCRAEAV